MVAVAARELGGPLMTDDEREMVFELATVLSGVLSGLAPARITCSLGRTMTSSHTACSMLSTVMVRRRNWSLRQSAGTC